MKQESKDSLQKTQKNVGSLMVLGAWDAAPVTPSLTFPRVLWQPPLQNAVCAAAIGACEGHACGLRYMEAVVTAASAALASPWEERGQG